MYSFHQTTTERRQLSYACTTLPYKSTNVSSPIADRNKNVNLTWNSDWEMKLHMLQQGGQMTLILLYCICVHFEVNMMFL